MALARQRLGAQGEARHRDHRHLVDPPAQDLHQRRAPTTRRRCFAQIVIHITFLLSALAIACGRPRHAGIGPRAAQARARRMTIIREDDFIQSVADALQFISYYHPADYIRAPRRAPTSASSRRRRRTRSRRSSPTRACAPKAIGRSARTPASSTSSSRSAWTCAGTRRLARGHGQRGRAPRLQPPGQQAARLDARRLRCRPQEHHATTRRRSSHMELVPGDKVEVTSRRRAAARRTSRSSRCSTRPTRSSTGC